MTGSTAFEQAHAYKALRAVNPARAAKYVQDHSQVYTTPRLTRLALADAVRIWSTLLFVPAVFGTFLAAQAVGFNPTLFGLAVVAAFTVVTLLAFGMARGVQRESEADLARMFGVGSGYPCFPNSVAQLQARAAKNMTPTGQ